MKTRKPRPKIPLHLRDHAKLMKIAEGWMSIRPELAEVLLQKLDLARLTDHTEGTVQMGSTLVYTSGDGTSRQVTLVYPEWADISMGAISVLTPIGSALLGMPAGGATEFQGNDGRQRRLAVVAVVSAAQPDTQLEAV